MSTNRRILESSLNTYCLSSPNTEKLYSTKNNFKNI